MILSKEINKKITYWKFKNKYKKFLKNPERFKDQSAQLLLRKTFVECGIGALEWAVKEQKKISEHNNRQVSSNFFPNLEESGIKAAVQSLVENRYYVMPWALPSDWITTVRKKLENFHVTSRDDKNDIQLAGKITPKSSTYWHGDEIMEISELGKLVDDEGIKEIIGRYLGCKPVFDFIACWWTYPNGNPDAKSAQLYHYDLDRIKWVKVFIYLNDVELKNGPHAYVKGSHRDVDKKIGRDGRLSDREVFEKYSKHDEIIFTGLSGTMILEDTLGLHKGIPAIEGHRLIFEYEYSINHFGYPNPDISWK